MELNQTDTDPFSSDKLLIAKDLYSIIARMDVSIDGFNGSYTGRRD